jgi:hypothetical protein
MLGWLHPPVTAVWSQDSSRPPRPRSPAGLVMSTIPKRKHKRSDIEANYRNESETF